MAQVEEVKILQVDTTKSVNAVKALRKSMKDLDSAFISGTISEEKYVAETKKLESEMFKVTDAHKDAKLSINDFGVQMKNVSTVGKAVTGALTGIQAGMNALGLESSGVAEKISKLQNLQALTEAFGALKDDGVKAFKGLKDALGSATKGLSGFKKVLIGTGLGAIVVIIGSLIANWDEFTNSLGISGEVLDSLSDKIKGFFNIFKEGAKRIAQTIGKLLSGDWSGIKEVWSDFSIVDSFNAGVEASVEERNKKIVEENRKVAEEAKKAAIEQLNAKQSQLDAELEYQKSIHDKEWENSLEYKDKMKKYYDELLSLYKSVYGEDSLEYKKLLSQKNVYFRDFVSNEDKALEEQRKREDAAAQEQLAKEKEQNKKKQALLKELSDYKKGEQQTELDNLKAKYEEDLKLLGDNLDAKKLLEQRYQEEVDDINEKYKQPKEEGPSVFSTIKDGLAETQELLSGFDTPFSEATNSILSELSVLTVGFEDLHKKIEEGDATWGDYAAVAGASISSVGNMISALSDMQDTSTKEGFEKQKKMQIAAATMQMVGGIVTALSGTFTTKTGPWDIILAAAQAASIAVAGGLQINKIKQQKFDSAGSTSLSAPSLNVASAADIANSSLNTREIISNSEAESSLSATKVYVTESDIASTNKKVQTVESENTL